MNSAAATTTLHRTLPAALWQQYRRTGDPDARRQLLELYIGLVHHVARELGRRTNAAELDDLVSAGTFGLIRALDSFDLGRGLAFSTYAVRRIRGAILDDLRSQDWTPRAVRVKARRLQVATVTLQTRLGRMPRPDEVAAQLDIDITTYWRWRDDTATRSVLSYEGEARGSAGGAPLQDLLEDEETTAVHEELAREEDVKLLRDSIARLPEKERMVMALYYYEELTQRQIAEVMHLTESRVSQIRTQALKRLRTRLAAAGESR
ncbi:MAG TPA: FliA/WhiG family RNA polymerase sigma factor [Gemmatimonadales bacterium]